MLGFLIFINSITYLHEAWYYRGTVKSYLRLLYSVAFVGAFYYFVQVNFNQTSHNFGLRSFLFFDNTFFLFESLFLLTVLAYRCIFQISKLQRKYLLQNLVHLTTFSAKYTTQFLLTSVVYFALLS
jgi:hypothetical protein